MKFSRKTKLYRNTEDSDFLAMVYTGEKGLDFSGVDRTMLVVGESTIEMKISPKTGKLEVVAVHTRKICGGGGWDAYWNSLAILKKDLG